MIKMFKQSTACHFVHFSDLACHCVGHVFMILFFFSSAVAFYDVICEVTIHCKKFNDLKEVR